MCRVYTGYCGTSEIEHGLCACTVYNPLAKARGLSLRTGAQPMLYLPLIPKISLLPLPIWSTVFIPQNLDYWNSFNLIKSVADSLWQRSRFILIEIFWAIEMLQNLQLNLASIEHFFDTGVIVSLRLAFLQSGLAKACIEVVDITLMCLSIGTPKNNKFSICSKWKIHHF